MNLTRAEQIVVFQRRMMEAKDCLWLSGDYSSQFDCPVCSGSVVCTLDRRMNEIAAQCDTPGCCGMAQR